MDESSRVLSVSVLYLAGARWLSLRGQSARIQASLRVYPGGFPWVEPVSCKVQTVGGIQDVWGVHALELYEIPREEVAGGAVGVVQGGFPRGGAQRSVWDPHSASPPGEVPVFQIVLQVVKDPQGAGRNISCICLESFSMAVLYTEPMWEGQGPKVLDRERNRRPDDRNVRK
ncbi:hypothetical protein DFH09DRAFT_1105069 [Mycena vulgaris]|nr:hypothetical protein DFH09DRAFT_1105069 [Mycena vulgaris]